MPLQWKIYYWCSMYKLLWCITAFCFAAVYIISTPKKTSTDILEFCLTELILLVISFAAWQSIWVINRYRNYNPLNAKKSAFVLIGFVSQILVTVFICLLFIILFDFHFIHMDEEEGYEAKPWLDYKRVVPDFLFALMAICSLYTVFLYLPLIKTIRQKLHSSLPILGEKIETSIEV